MSELLPVRTAGADVQRRAAPSTFLTRTAAALSAFRMVFSGYGGGGAGSGYRWPGFLGGLLPGSRRDWAKLAGDVTLNSAAAICLGWIGDNMVEPELRVYKGVQDGRPVPVPGHPLLEFLDQPNPHYDLDTLLCATAISYAAHGNAYWLKIRDQAGDLAEIWFVPHWQIDPRWPSDGSEFISHYEYRVNGEAREVPCGDVVHFRFGIDPANTRLGLGRLRPVMREIVTDNAANSLEAALLLNMGIPSVMIVPADPAVVVTEPAAEKMQNEFAARYSGDRAGKPMIPSVPVKVEKLGLSPDEMAMTAIRNVPESRICGALRISPQVVGLTVGDRSKTFRNYELALRAAYQDCIYPLGRRLARTIKRGVLTEFERDVAGFGVAFDYANVPALREDRTAIYRRNTVGVTGRWMKINEARAAAGFDLDPRDDRYLDGPAPGANDGGMLGGGA
jgi:HK97 family phage portal protein